MMNPETDTYYPLLQTIRQKSDDSLLQAYRRLRELLERLCRDFMHDENLQMTDMAARITYLGNRCALSRKQVNRLHTVRLTSNAVLNRREEPDEAAFLRDWATVVCAVQWLHHLPIPDDLAALLPQEEGRYTPGTRTTRRYKRLRVCFQEADEQYLYVSPIDFVSDDWLRVTYNEPHVNDAFATSVPRFWKYAQLNLLDVSIDDYGICHPEFLILEPDYLIDISSLAECYKDYGSKPGNYILNRLVPIDNPLPLLLGNIANLFLDECIHAHQAVDYLTCMRKAFRMYPLDLASCKELSNPDIESDFFSKCRMHFDHIQDVVTNKFRSPGYQLDADDAVLEPSYICEALGVQGRLDYMQRDMHAFIEMKSGKADEYMLYKKIEPKENNRVQMLLYMAVLEFSMGVSHQKQQPYLLYTRYPLLYPANSSWSSVKRVMNLRNLIVADEFAVQLHNHIDFTRQVLDKINPEELNERGLSGNYWCNYLRPNIENFRKRFDNLSALEQAYYLTTYNFITKELYTSKSGDIDYDGRTGASALWLSSLLEKREAGEIFYDLRLTDNHASDEHKAYVVLEKPDYGDDFHPNFRLGDMVVLYERNVETDKATNKMIFKGCIEAMDARSVKVRFRAAQRNLSVLPDDSLYALEHDFMDANFRVMYRGLHAFATANADRRDLLLCQRPPLFDREWEGPIAQAPDDFERIALKAMAARDCFLLVGPPGTGKTSRALRRMVELFYSRPDAQLLLLAYTNRAVDEICESIMRISPEIPFIRVGSELSCEEPYRPFLLENAIAHCQRRSDVRQRLEACRVYVGTVASVSSKTELFKLKTFDVAIVDEATQILEPQLLGILCARTPDGENAVRKFVLIGDHKQLPAVVLQNEQQTRVNDERLKSIGLVNMRDSLFERLYRNYIKSGDWTVDMLCRQGRMNPEVAFFSNEFFYEGKLLPVGLSHQQGGLTLPSTYQSSVRDLLLQRVAFIDVAAEKDNPSGKSNRNEARIVARLAREVYASCEGQFTEKTLGIITPYRSQIALIRKELDALDIDELNHVMVDTVERYQGSERDVIIYSFCVNHLWQLRFLCNMMEENGHLIDRKLNVALTRARKQLYLVGDSKVLSNNPIYAKLLTSVANWTLPGDFCG